MSVKILIIDDEEGIRFAFKKFLSSTDYDVTTAENYNDAVDFINKTDFDVILADIILGNNTGIDILKKINKKNIICPVILITGYPSLDSATKAIRLGAFDYMQKPITKKMLLNSIDVALKHKKVVEAKKIFLNENWTSPIKVIVLVAHPDDEVLGCGGWISCLTKNKSDVTVIFTTDGIRHAPVSTNSREDAYKALKVIGVRKENVHFLGIKTQRSDEYTLRDFTPLVEHLGKETDLVITTSEHDLNVDHLFAYKLALTCFRPITNRTKIISMEILSSSEWSAQSFQPNYYVDISSTIESKVSALKKYVKQVLPFPHPRSPKAIRVKSQQRGLEAGYNNAEAFHIVRWF